MRIINRQSTKKEMFTSRKRKRQAVVCIMLFLLIIAPLSLYLFNHFENPEIIQIDGEFSDWDSVPSFHDSANDQNILDLNIQECKIQKEEEFSKDDLMAVAEEIDSHVDRASKVIKHMRDFARQSDLTRTRLNINEPIKDVFKVLGQQLRVHQIEVELDLDPHVPPIMADHNRLEQVFINLVTNAMYAMDDKGLRWGDRKWRRLLRIKSFSADGRVVVSVSDTGKGIPKDIIDKIFEPFFTTREVGQGTGLGMSISYRIISDYGGTIEVRSEVDAGTTFTLKFPSAE